MTPTPLGVVVRNVLSKSSGSSSAHVESVAVTVTKHRIYSSTYHPSGDLAIVLLVIVYGALSEFLKGTPKCLVG